MYLANDKYQSSINPSLKLLFPNICFPHLYQECHEKCVHVHVCIYCPIVFSILMMHSVNGRSSLRGVSM